MTVFGSGQPPWGSFAVPYAGSMPPSPPAYGYAAFRVGELVEALYHEGHGPHGWYEATIAEILPDGTYVLDWHDGDDEDRTKQISELRKVATVPMTMGTSMMMPQPQQHFLPPPMTYHPAPRHSVVTSGMMPQPQPQPQPQLQPQAIMQVELAPDQRLPTPPRPHREPRHATPSWQEPAYMRQSRYQALAEENWKSQDQEIHDRLNFLENLVRRTNDQPTRDVVGEARVRSIQGQEQMMKQLQGHNKPFTVELNLRAQDHIGLEFFDVDPKNPEMLMIKRVHESCPVDVWNENSQDNIVCAGDRIISVNGKTDREGMETELEEFGRQVLEIQKGRMFKTFYSGPHAQFRAGQTAAEGFYLDNMTGREDDKVRLLRAKSAHEEHSRMCQDNHPIVYFMAGDAHYLQEYLLHSTGGKLARTLTATARQKLQQAEGAMKRCTQP